MRKTYVFDTSALIYDPQAYNHFPHSNIVIPIAVLNELDKLKKQPGDAGRNARACTRFLDELSAGGNIVTGVFVGNNTQLKIDATHYDISNPAFSGFGDPTYGDTQILACTYAHWYKDNSVTLVTNDINLRVKAKSRGMDAAAHQVADVSYSELFSGSQAFKDEEAFEEMTQIRTINVKDYPLSLMPNECVEFSNEAGEVMLGRNHNGKVKAIRKQYPWNISPRNNEQEFAIDLLMDKNIDLVTMSGKAGTGKSLVVLACALELVLNKKEYQKLIIYRPIQPMGNDIGYMPGTMEEKLAPWFQAVLDNLEMLFSFKNGDNWKKTLEMFQKKGLIEMSALTYIRGRSLPNSLIFIDEVQNISKEEIKTILTRAGEGSKIVLCGDAEQIDNKFLDFENNGLVHVIEKFKNFEMAGHITLTQGERSKLASKAAEIL